MLTIINEKRIKEMELSLQELKKLVVDLDRKIEWLSKKQLKSNDLGDVLRKINSELMLKNSHQLDGMISHRLESYFANTGIAKESAKTRPLFLIGSGPSLKNCDLSILKNCYTMSFNRSYIAFSDWKFEPTYFGGIDSVVNEDNVKEFKKLIENSKIERFFFNRNPFTLDNYSSVKTTLVELGENTNPNLDFSKRIRTSNSGLFGLQVALGILGFKEVYLLGCDANYIEKVEGIAIRGHKYISQGDTDPNHFRNDYFGKGRVYNKPDANLYHLPAWKTFYEQVIKNNSSGYKIYNCSKIGKLTFFEFKDFEELSKDIQKFEKS